MLTTSLSDVTVIATALGVFFLIVAFYKSLFHKRRPPAQNLPNHPPTTALRDDLPVKLNDPFQQVPIDKLPLHPPEEKTDDSSFYPAFPHPAEPPVSAFRQFNPHQDFDASAGTSSTQKKEADYEWE